MDLLSSRAGNDHRIHPLRTPSMVRPIERVFGFLFKSGLGHTPDIFDSRIEGEFDGWSGSTLFPLVNGQIWQQCCRARVRHQAHSPAVVIYRSGAGHKMKVDGVDQTISVKRLK
jgi:hypothetical protein